MNKSLPIRSIGIFALPGSIEQSSLIDFTIKQLYNCGFEVFISEETLQLIKLHGFEITIPTLDKNINSVDCILSLGGDGTVLKAAHFIKDKQKPIVGINAGRLGFLADSNKENINSRLLDLKAGQYSIEERTMLESEIEGFDNSRALNEISVQKQGQSSILTIKTYINNDYLSSFWADGIIVGTPTGSTAYSLSLGGPIIAPNSNVFIINPIAPHTLTVRPIVIPDTSVIKLVVSGRDSDYILSHDSNLISLQKELEINISKASYTIKFIKFNDYNYYSTLRHKLMWGADIRN